MGGSPLSCVASVLGEGHPSFVPSPGWPAQMPGILHPAPAGLPGLWGLDHHRVEQQELLTWSLTLWGSLHG